MTMRDFVISLTLAFAGSFAFASIVPAPAETFDQRWDAAFPHVAQAIENHHPVPSPKPVAKDACERHGMHKVWRNHHRSWNCK